MTTHGALGGIGPWRIAGWSLAALMLLLPLIAMRFTSEVNWTGSDFVFAAVLIGSVGIGFELAVRNARSLAYRAGSGLALAASFLIVWVNGAVGMIGSEDNPYNLLFGLAIVVALLGGAAARFRARGMVLAMAAAGATQLAIALGGLSTDLRGGVLSALLSGLWLLSAALFHSARKGEAR